MSRNIKRILILVLGLPVLVIGGCVGLMFWPSEPTIQRDLVGVDWLPKSASHITVYESPGFGWMRVFQCKISEPELRLLAIREGWQLEEKNEIYVSHRYLLGLPPLQKKHGIAVDWVKRGLFYELRHGNGGGVTVVYDFDLQLLIVSQSHR